MAQRYNGGKLFITPDFSSYSGVATYSVGWNEAPPWDIYFCANFSEPAAFAGTFSYAYDFVIPPPVTPTLYPYLEVSAFSAYGLGVLFSWNATSTVNSVNWTLESRVGISFISREKACAFVKEEVGQKSFGQVWESAKAEWNEDVLRAVTVNKVKGEAENATLLTMLYTALYGTAIMVRPDPVGF